MIGFNSSNQEKALGDGVGLGTLPVFNVLSGKILPRVSTWDFGLGNTTSTASAPFSVNINGDDANFLASGSITFRGLRSCDTIDTDSNGLLSCGTDTGGGSGSADSDVPFVTIGNTSSLSFERALTGTSNQITVSDGGANGAATLSIPTLFVMPGTATVSSNFEVLGYASVGGNLFVNGNAGIGHAVPANKLDVNGSLALATSGFVGFVGNTAVTTSNYSLFGNTTLTLVNARSGASIGFRIANTDVANFSTTGGFGFGSTYYNLDPGQNNMTVEGNLGVGKATPTTKLDVGGSASISTNFEVASGYASISNTLFVDTGTNGYVGIGTTVPTSALNVRSSVGDYGIVRVINSGTNGEAGIGFRDDSDSDAQSWVIGKSVAGQTDKFVFYYAGEKMTIQTDGNVGIGNTAPDAKLTVGDDPTAGDANFTSVVAANGVSAIFSDNTNSSLWIKHPSSGLTNLNADSGGQFSFSDGDVENIRIDGSGNLGIGDTSPTTKLDVSGSASISLNFEVLGYASVSGKFTQNTSASNSFSGSLSGPTTGTLSVGTSNNYLKILWSNIVRAITRFIQPTGTSTTTTAEAGERFTNTSSKSEEFNDGTTSRSTGPCDRYISYVLKGTDISAKNQWTLLTARDPFRLTEVSVTASGSNSATLQWLTGSATVPATSIMTHQASGSSITTYSSFTTASISDGYKFDLRVTSASATLESIYITNCLQYDVTEN